MFPFFPDPDPLISRPELYNHWEVEVIFIAHPILCVCVLTAPVRGLAGLIAVGSMKCQLLVSAFNENLWLNLSRACTNSAVLLSIKSGENNIIPPQLDLFESLECMPQELVPPKNYEHSFQGWQKSNHVVHFTHFQLQCFVFFFTKHKRVSKNVPEEMFHVAETKPRLTFCCVSQISSTNNFPQPCPVVKVLEYWRLLPRSSTFDSSLELLCCTRILKAAVKSSDSGLKIFKFVLSSVQYGIQH